jgi:hypothetical protein
LISTGRYTKSTFSGEGNCVEVCLLDDGRIELRDSKDTAKPAHVFTSTEWLAFVLGVRAGEFDLPEFVGSDE